MIPNGSNAFSTTNRMIRTESNVAMGRTSIALTLLALGLLVLMAVVK